jgi:protein required for attachment to host cells
MMNNVVVHNGAWVLVGDGRKALFFINKGSRDLLDLRVVETRIDENPATRDQGTDRPGRAFASVGGARSAVGDTDWHEVEEERFARAIAERINAGAEANEFSEIVIVAPPKTLGEIRKDLSKKAQGKVAGELGKDLTRHPLADIEKALTHV